MQYSSLIVCIDQSLLRWDAEIEYVFRTLLFVAGYPVKFIWGQLDVDSEIIPDIYYGPVRQNLQARVHIPANGMNYFDCHQYEPLDLIELEGISYLKFSQDNPGTLPLTQEGLHFAYDIIYSSFWLLTGARETYYRRNKVDDLDIEGFFFYDHWLFSKPLVSVYGQFLRSHFKSLGYTPLEYPWISGKNNAAFIFTHDVDYPQIIRWIETIRLFRARGLKGIPSIVGVIEGSNHFWKFSDWMEFESELGARSVFYFMARKGSLLEYARGVPDSFYDIRRPEFLRLFRQLVDAGFEIGLHASFNAYKSLDQLQSEKRKLEELSDFPVPGNRFHYWHLDPDRPHETLKLSEQAGLLYDSSLGYEYYPGFRRGICHPFRIYHPGDRRELDLIELPPTWMDNHFDKRLLKNRISDPIEYARGLVNTACKLQGMIIVDYHARGMNADFYPKFGPWLKDFVHNHLSNCVDFHLPVDLARMYIEYENKLLSIASKQENSVGIS